jgi:hypothetical protein
MVISHLKVIHDHGALSSNPEITKEIERLRSERKKFGVKTKGYKAISIRMGQLKKKRDSPEKKEKSKAKKIKAKKSSKAKVAVKTVSKPKKKSSRKKSKRAKK